MAALPLHPRLAHMVTAGKALGAGALAADLAVLLSERDPLPRDSGADIGFRIVALKSGQVAQRVRDGARQIRSMARIDAKEEPAVPIGVLVAFAWPDRIGRRGADVDDSGCRAAAERSFPSTIRSRARSGWQSRPPTEVQATSASSSPHR